MEVEWHIGGFGWIQYVLSDIVRFNGVIYRKIIWRTVDISDWIYEDLALQNLTFPTLPSEILKIFACGAKKEVIWLLGFSKI